MPRSKQTKAVEIPTWLHEGLAVAADAQRLGVADLVRQILAHELYEGPEHVTLCTYGDPCSNREGPAIRGELTPCAPAYVMGRQAYGWDDRRRAGARQGHVPR